MGVLWGELRVCFLFGGGDLWGFGFLGGGEMMGGVGGGNLGAFRLFCKGGGWV